MMKPEDAIRIIRRKYGTLRRIWLIAETEWPIVISIKGPEPIEMLDSFPKVCEWIDAWHEWNPANEVEWIQKRSKHGGSQLLPVRLILSGPERIAALIGKSEEWIKSVSILDILCTKWAPARNATIELIDQLVLLERTDFERFINTVEWLILHPDSGLLIRQIPVRGIDTKWLEKRKALVHTLVASLHEISGTGSILSDLGLCILPERIRVIILDPDIRRIMGGIRDLTIPVTEAMTLNLPFRNAIIVENLQTAISLPDLPLTVAIAHLGYHVDILGRLPWLLSLQCFYWGDIDTHGLAILSRARKYIPTIESVMMDEATLLIFQDLWAFEKVQSAVTYPEELNETEQHLFTRLKNTDWGSGVRLEQERISMEFASKKLFSMLSRNSLYKTRKRTYCIITQYLSFIYCITMQHYSCFYCIIMQ
jgi:Uncharacterized protein conserved in bacteria